MSHCKSRLNIPAVMLCSLASLSGLAFCQRPNAGQGTKSPTCSTSCCKRGLNIPAVTLCSFASLSGPAFCLHTPTCQTGWCFSAYPSRGAPPPLLCYTPMLGSWPSLDGKISKEKKIPLVMLKISVPPQRCLYTAVASWHSCSIFKRFSSKAKLLKVQTILLLFCKHKYHMRSGKLKILKSMLNSVSCCGLNIFRNF